MVGVVFSWKSGSSLLIWVSLLLRRSCGVDLQSQVLGGTLQCMCTVVGIGSIAVDLLADMERKAEEATSRTFHRADKILLHLLGKLDSHRNLFDVVQLLEGSEQVSVPALDTTFPSIIVETFLQMNRQIR